MPLKATMFLNPTAGVKIGGEDASALREAARGRSIEVIELSRDVSVREIVRERRDQGVKLFIAGGGDGTINNVVQQLVNTDSVLAVLPLGTYNHFARDVGIPLDWRAALEIAVSGDTRQIDTARVNDRFFLNNLSLGLYPELVARREEKGRDYPRWKARLFAVYSTLRRYPHVTLNVETEHHQEVVRTHVFMVSNNTYDLSRLGIEAPRNALTEGRLSVYWLPHLPRIALTRFAAHYLAGKVTTAPGFRSFRTLRMKVRSPRPRLHVGIDGEVLTIETPLAITIVPQSLLVRVPRMSSRA